MDAQLASPAHITQFHFTPSYILRATGQRLCRDALQGRDGRSLGFGHAGRRVDEAPLSCHSMSGLYSSSLFADFVYSLFSKTPPSSWYDNPPIAETPTRRNVDSTTKHTAVDEDNVPQWGDMWAGKLMRH